MWVGGGVGLGDPERYGSNCGTHRTAGAGGGGTGYKDDSWLIIALLPPSLGSCMVALAVFLTNVTNPSLGRVRGAPSRGVLTVGSWCDLLT